MNSSSIVTLPSTELLNLYWNYSNFTLILSWILAPFLFYVILTQSHNLGTFKWLILNHCIWCLNFQTVIALGKPLILSPTLAGYPMGLLRNGNYQSTAIYTMIIVTLFNACNASLFITLFCRYMLVFPTSGITRYLTKKLFIITTFIGAPVCILINLLMLTKMFLTDKETILEWAKNDFDSTLFNFLSNEPAFVMAPFQVIEYPMLIIIILDTAILLGAIVLGLIFIYHLITFKIVSSKTNLKRSLLLSGAIQVLLVFILLFIPFNFIPIFIRFQFSNSAETLCWVFMVMLTHFPLESITTLIFVSPYRKYVTNLGLKLLLFFKCCKPKIGNIKIKVVKQRLCPLAS